MEYRYKHIVVVHGIGNQEPNETALNFMNEFIYTLREDRKGEVFMYNLIESVDNLAQAPSPTHSRKFQPANIIYTDYSRPNDPVINIIGFSEVYWQPITNGYLDKDEKLPIPIFTWARTIANRLYDPGRDLTKWRLAIENLEKILRYLKWLAIHFKKAELFNTITQKFLGDVQMYAESDQIRKEINKQFFRVVSRIKDFSSTALANTTRHIDSAPEFDRLRKMVTFKKPEAFQEKEIEIYIVAHSEGTVVSYNSLVWAAMASEGSSLHSGDTEFQLAEDAITEVNKALESKREPDSPPFNWLPCVKGFVTLGSPLDKHFTIWRNRFRKNLLKSNNYQPIPWQNYTDKNDPVGYELKELTKRDNPDSPTDAERLFNNEKEDHLYQRYPIPGVAHIGYWSDKSIYRRIIRLMKLSEDTPPAMKNAWWSPLVYAADIVLYLSLRIILLVAGIYFANRLFHTDALSWLSCLDFIKNTRDALPPVLFADTSLEKDLFWLAAMSILLKLFVELEKGIDFSYEKKKYFSFPQWPRYILGIPWLVTAIIVCIDFSAKSASGSIKDIIGYLTGLGITILLWRLHTSIHTGLLQLWRYTRIL